MAQMVSISQQLGDMRAFLTKRADELQRALPKTAQLDASRFIRVVLTNFQLTPKLLECTKASLYVSMLQAAQFGLELDPLLGHAYLVPFKGRCQLMIGYKGYMLLARRSGEVTSIGARVVRVRDVFDYEEGLERKLIHKPYMGNEDPGPVVAAYVIARFKDGDFSMNVMSTRDINAIRKRSRAGDSGPWVTDYDAMAMKTVIRRDVKFWPSSVELQQAANLDEQLDTGQDQTFTLDPADYNLVEEGETQGEGEKPETKQSGLDKLAQMASTKDVTPDTKEAPPPPPAEAPGPIVATITKPPLPKPAPTKRTVEKDPEPDPPLDARALGDQEITEGRERSRQAVQERHEVPRHQRQAQEKQPGLPTREPGEEG